MERLRTAMEPYIKHFSNTASVYTTVIGLFIYHVILHRDLLCTCQGQQSDCDVYMTVPAVLIIIFALWVDKTFQRTLKYCCGCQCQCDFCCIFWSRILRAVFLGLLWVVSVYIDGDWYVCCWNQTEHKLLACTKEEELKPDEKANKNVLKNESRGIGLGLLLAIILVAGMLQGCKSAQSSCCKGNVVLKKIILEEEENLLKTKLREAAKDKLSKRLNNHVTKNEWGKCFDVAEEVITQMFTQVNQKNASPPDDSQDHPAGQREQLQLQERRAKSSTSGQSEESSSAGI